MRMTPTRIEDIEEKLPAASFNESRYVDIVDHLYWASKVSATLTPTGKPMVDPPKPTNSEQLVNGST